MKKMIELAAVGLMLASASSVVAALTIENDTNFEVNVSYDCGSIKDSFELPSGLVDECVQCLSAVGTCDYTILSPSRIGCSGTVDMGAVIKVNYVDDDLSLSCAATQAPKK